MPRAPSAAPNPWMVAPSAPVTNFALPLGVAPPSEPSVGQFLSPLDRAIVLLTGARNRVGRQGLARMLRVDPSFVSMLMGGTRPASPTQLAILRSLESPSIMFPEPDRQHLYPWLGKVPIGSLLHHPDILFEDSPSKKEGASGAKASVSEPQRSRTARRAKPRVIRNVPSIDKLVLVGDQPVNEHAASLPRRLTFPERMHNRKLSRPMRTAATDEGDAFVIDDDLPSALPVGDRKVVSEKLWSITTHSGEQVQLLLKTSNYEWASSRPGNLRYRRHVEVFALGRFGNVRVALFSFEHRVDACDAHRWVRGDHKKWRCGCSTESSGQCDRSHYHWKPPPQKRCGSCAFDDERCWTCPACRELNRCPICDARTAKHPTARYEVMGSAWRLGIGFDLLRQLVAPMARPGRLRIDEIHLAVDVEAPPEAIVPFQNDTVDRSRLLKSLRRYGNGANVVPGFIFGDGKFEVVFYDKLAEAAAKAVPRPAWTEGWSHVSRIEFRLRPLQLGVDVDAVDALTSLPRLWTGFSLADLSFATPDAPETTLALCAKVWGILSVRPTTKFVLARRKSKPITEGKKPASCIDFGHLALDEMRWHDARACNPEWEAGLLHNACLDELHRLTELGGIDVGAIIDNSLLYFHLRLGDSLGPAPAKRASTDTAGTPAFPQATPPPWKTAAAAVSFESLARLPPMPPPSLPQVRSKNPYAIVSLTEDGDGEPTLEAQTGGADRERGGGVGGRVWTDDAPGMPGRARPRFVPGPGVVAASDIGRGGLARGDVGVRATAAASRARWPTVGVWQGEVVEERDEAWPVLGAGGDPRRPPRREPRGVPEAPRRRVRRAVTHDGLRAREG